MSYKISIRNFLIRKLDTSNSIDAGIKAIDFVLTHPDRFPLNMPEKEHMAFEQASSGLYDLIKKSNNG